MLHFVLECATVINSVSIETKLLLELASTSNKSKNNNSTIFTNATIHSIRQSCDTILKNLNDSSLNDFYNYCKIDGINNTYQIKFIACLSDFKAIITYLIELLKAENSEKTKPNDVSVTNIIFAKADSFFILINNIKNKATYTFNPQNPKTEHLIHTLLEGYDFLNYKADNKGLYQYYKEIYQSTTPMEHQKNITASQVKNDIDFDDYLLNKLSNVFYSDNKPKPSNKKENHALVYIEALNNGCVVESIREQAIQFSKSKPNDINYKEYTKEISDKPSMEAFLFASNKPNQLYFIYQSKISNPKFLLANWKQLQNCIIVLDGFPIPRWECGYDFHKGTEPDVIPELTNTLEALTSPTHSWQDVLNNITSLKTPYPPVHNKIVNCNLEHIEFFLRERTNDLDQKVKEDTDFYQQLTDQEPEGDCLWIVISRLPDPLDHDGIIEHREASSLSLNRFFPGIAKPENSIIYL